METDEYQTKETKDKDAVMAEVGKVGLNTLDRFEDDGRPSDNSGFMDMDPTLTNWFKVEPQSTPAAATNLGQDPSSETEPDLDHDSLSANEGEVDKEWLKVEANKVLPDSEVLEVSKHIRYSGST